MEKLEAQPHLARPTVKEADRGNTELVIPKSEDIKAAFDCDPDAASDDLKAKMEFFLNVVFPSIEPKMMKADMWLARNCNHMEWFGQRWPVEVAMGMAFLDHFSDQANIKHNKGIINGVEEDSQTQADKKKKGKMQSKEVVKKMETELLQNKKHCAQLLMNVAGFDQRMLQWDKQCCEARELAANETAPRLANHVPPPLGRAAPHNEFEGSFLECVTGQAAGAGVAAV